MNLFKQKLNNFLLITIFMMIGVFAYAGNVHAQYWVSNPANCPSSDTTNYPGQDCNSLDICGVVAGNIDCYNTSLINPPVGSENNSTTNQDTAGTNAGSFNGGYILNCYANDGSVPRCNDNGTWWCDRSSTCYGVNRNTTCVGGLAASSTCGTCIAGYNYCDGSYDDADGCEVQTNVTNCSAGANNRIDGSCTCICDANYYDCNASGANAGNGCEVQNGGACAVGSLVGTWNGPTCTCEVNKSYFETGTQVAYSSNDPLLWGDQYGDGPLLKMTSINASTTGGVFFVGNDGKVGIGTSSPSAMLTVGYESGSQFLVNATGTVLSGTWNGSPIGLAYGGTGVNLSAGTGFLYVSGGLTIASSTIDIGLTNINTGSGLTMSGSTISLDNSGNWVGTFDGFEGANFLTRSDWFATTSAPQFTSLINLATIGTITSGTWNGSIIDIAYGGTGTNTLNNLITLGTHTIGNYISSTTGSDTITITGTLGEGWTPVFSVTNDSITASKLAMSGSGNGNLNQVLISDGNGTFSWSDIGTTNGTVREGFAGQLAFYIADGMTATGTTNLFWDNNNYRLGIGTTTPGAALSIGVTTGSQFLVSSAGLITDGTWNGDQIDDDYVASSTYWNAAYQARIVSATAPITFSGNTIGLDGLYNIPLIASTTAWNAVAASSTFYNTNSNIVNSNYANWNNAFSWGDHRLGNYFSTTSNHVLEVAYGGTGATSLNNLITLGTHTTGNYISSTTGSNTITITGTPSEGWVPVFSVTDDSITAAKLAMSGSGIGNVNQVLISDGNGTFSWSDIGTTNGTVKEGFAGQLAFYVADGMTATGTTGLFWDNGNARLGIGTTTPGAALSIGVTTGSQFLVSSAGLITDGTWNGDQIDDDYVASSTYWNAAYQARIVSATAPITFTGNTIGLDGLYNIPLVASTTQWNAAYNWGDHSGRYDAIGQATSTLAYHTSMYNHASYDAVVSSSSLYNWAYNTVNSNYLAWNAVAASSTFYNTNANLVNSNYLAWNAVAASSTFYNTNSNIVNSNYANWNNAFSWGDYRLQNYFSTTSNHILEVAYGGTGATSLNNLITLGTHTTGNYISSTTGSNTITITGTPSEGWVPVFSVTDDSITASKLALGGANGNQYQVLMSDGDGTFSWTDAGASSGYVKNGVAGQLAFYATSGITATGTTNLFWDNNNYRLGIGTTTPGAALSIGVTTGSQFLVSSAGLITDGTWNGDQIDDDYVASSTYWNAAYQARIVSATAPITFTGNTIGLDGLYNIPLVASTSQWNSNYNLVNSKYANWDAVYASSTFYNLAYSERGSQIAGTNLSWSGGQLHVADNWYNSLSDLALATGNIYIGDGSNHPAATSSLYMTNSGYIGLGTSSASITERLTVDGNILLSGNITPVVASSSNIGSLTHKFLGGYFTNLYVDNLDVGGTSIAGSESNIFTINSDAAGPENSTLAFYRGPSTTATIYWNDDTDTFDFNFPVSISNSQTLKFFDNDGSSNYVALRASSSLASNLTWTLPTGNGNAGDALSWGANGELVWSTPSGTGGTIGAASVIGQLPYYAAATNALTPTSSLFLATNGNLGIGTTTPIQKLVVGGYGAFTGLCINGDCKTDWATAGAFDGGGAINSVAIWTDANTLGSSTTLPIYLGGTGASTLNDLITLGTHTTGNYISSTTGSDTITITGTPGEGWVPVFSVTNDSITASKLAVGSNGVNGQVLTADGDGTFSWQNAGASSGMVKEGLAGQLAFYASNGIVATGTTNLFWDNNNYRLGIGTTTPGAALSIGVTTGSQFLVSSAGLITDGTWNGDQIDDDYVASSTYWNAAYQARIVSATAPITFIGNTIGLDGNYNIPLTASTSQWNSNYNLVNSKYANWDAVYASSTFYNTNSNIVNSNYTAWNAVVSSSSLYNWAYNTVNSNYLAWNAVAASSTFYNQAYNWGNHAGLYDILGQATSTLAYHTGMYNHVNYDAVVASSTFYNTNANIVNSNYANWNNAYTYGISTAGTGGEIWMSDGNGAGVWTSTSSLIWDNDFTANGLMVRTAAGTYTSTSTLAINYGGTGATTIAGAIINLGLDNIVTYGITTAGNNGELWMSDGSGAGIWTATSTLGLYTGTIGIGAQGYIPYYTGANNNLTATSALFIGTNGNIGIGTTTTSTYNLTVQGSLYADEIYSSANSFHLVGYDVLSIDNGLSLYNGSYYARLKASSTMTGNLTWVLPSTQGSAGESMILGANGVLTWGTPTGAGLINSGTTGQLAYYASNGQTLTGTSSIYIASTGNVGIGTTTANNSLSVLGDMKITSKSTTTSYRKETSAADFNAGTLSTTTVSGSGIGADLKLNSYSVFSNQSSNWLGYDTGQYASPAFADIDADGDYDLVVGDFDGGMDFVRNDGSASAPSWTYVTSTWLPNNVSYSTPAFADIDGDGDYDLAVGNDSGFVEYFRNDGSINSPSWTFVSSDWLSADVGASARPAFADIDNDGDKDMVVGDATGYVEYYRNDGSASSPIWTQISVNWLPNDVGSDAKPAFIDVDGDGDLDLIVGNVVGNLYFFRNTGTISSPSWTFVSSNWLPDCDTGSNDNNDPAFVDINNDGDMDLVVGRGGGLLLYYENITNYYATGTIISQSIDTQQTAHSYTTLNWTETLPANTDIQMQLRSADTSGSLSSATWYGPTGTGDYYTASGQTINSIHNGKRYIQYKAILTTSDSANTPLFKDVTINFSYYSNTTVDSNGNFGIGVSPSAAFDVNGLFKVDNAGYVTAGNWQGSAIDTTYGGLGGNFSAATGYLYVSGGAVTANATINIANTDLVGGTGLTLLGSTMNLDEFAMGTTDTNATAGSVFFAGTNGVMQQDNSGLFWNDANNRLGIGTSTPSAMLSVGSTTSSQFLVNTVGQVTGGTWMGGVIGLAYGGTNKNLAAAAGGIVYSDSDSLEILAAGTGGYIMMSNGSAAPAWVSTSTLLWDNDFSANGIMVRNAAGSYGASSSLAVYQGGTGLTSATAGYFIIGKDANNLQATSSIYISATGNFGVGTTSPLAKLDVYGNFMLSGTDRYINFATSSGTNGYGFRDNAGTLQYKNMNGQWTAFSTSTVFAIDDLNDVTITTAANGNLLKYNGSAWVNVATSTLGLQAQDSTLTSLAAFDTNGLMLQTATDIFTATSMISILYGGTGATTAAGARTNLGLDNIYTYGITTQGNNGELWMSDGSGAGTWRATNTLGLLGLDATITDLANVSAGSAVLGDILSYNGSEWINKATNTLGLLGNSIIAGLSTNSVTKWNGSALANSIITDTGTSTNIAGAMYVSGTTTMPSWNKVISVDGTTYAKNSTGIQAAINSLPAEGGKVFLPAGVYAVSATIIVPSNVWIEGAGASSTVLRVNDGANISAITNSDTTNGNVYIKISNLKIDGNKNNNSCAWTCHGILFTKVSYSEMNSVYVYQADGNGINFYGNGAAISNYNVIKNSILESNYGSGLNLNYGAYNTISNNTIKDNQTNSVHFDDSASSNIVSNNSITGGGYGGMALDGTNDSSNVITGNIISNNARSGIGIGNESGTGNNIISDNTIYNNGSTGAYDGIGIGGDNNVISANRIIDTAGTGYAINISSDGNNNTLSGNQYSGTGAQSINDQGTNTTYNQPERIALRTTATTSPVSYTALSVYATTTATLFEIKQFGTGDIMNVFDGATEVFTILDGGNVGIGTSSPAAKLDIYGNLLISGADRYANFGTDTGTSSYGFRDYGGTMQYKNSGGQWVNIGSAGSAGELGSLSNVSVGGAASGDLLMFNGSSWINRATSALGLLSPANIGSTVQAYDEELGDIAAISGQTTGDLIYWNGSAYVGIATSSLGFQASGNYLTDADFATNGIMVRTADGSYTTRVATGTDNEIISANSDGVSGNITFSLPDNIYLGTAGKIGRDADNLIDFSTDDKIAFRTNGTDRMLLDATGNLMIGTSTAGAKLTVMSSTGSQLRLAYDANNYVDFNVSATGEFTINGSAAAGSMLWIGEAQEEDTGLVLDGNAVDYWMALDDSDDIFKIGTSTTVGSGTVISILQNGNVGIGSSSPAYLLSVGSGFGISNTGTITGGTWQGGAIGIAYGGTGTTSAPTLGQILVGNSGGGYNLTATSSLGLQTQDSTLTSLAAFNSNGLMLQTAADTFSATTTLAINYGGTGATTIAGARTALGLAIGTDVQAYDATLNALSTYNTNGLIYQTGADTFAGTSTLAINFGGTGATTTAGAITNLGLDNIYTYGITTAGTNGQLWMSVGSGAGTWMGTSSLGLMSSGLLSGLSSNYIVRWNGSAFANSQLHDAGTYVGLGTNTPAYLLDVSASSTDYLTRIYNANTSASSSALSIRADGNGNLLNLNYAGTDVVTITGEQTTFNHPVVFNSVGDTTIANNLLMANAADAYIDFAGAGFIRTDSGWADLDLTLSAANNGDVVIDDTASISGTTSIASVLYVNAYEGRVGIGTNTPTALFAVGSTTLSQFLVNSNGQVTDGEWLAGVIGAAYGGTGTSTVFTNGSIVFASADGTYNQDNANLYFDNANNRLGIGTTSPLASLDIYGSIVLSGANRYINFGIETGTSSYGFRDYGGTMQYKNSGGQWVNIGSAGSGGTLGSMSDVSVGGAATGDLLKYNGSAWVNAATNTLGLLSPASIGSLVQAYDEELGDIAAISGQAVGDLIYWNGSAYVGIATSSLGLGGSGNYLDDSDFSTNGIMVRTASGAYTTRSATGTADEIVIANGDGVSGDITIGLPDSVFIGSAGKIGRDVDNLIDFSTDNQLTFRTNATNQMILDASGNLMLGTSTASSKLTILSTSNQLTLAYDASNYTNFSTDSSGRLNIVSSGAATAGRSLMILGSGSAADVGVALNGGTNDFWMGIDDTDGTFNIGTSTTIGSSTLFTLLANGNVGIGTTSPSQKLAVAGNAVITGTLSAGTTTVPSVIMTGGNALPSTATEGQLFYNTTEKKVYVYTGSRWKLQDSVASKVVAASDSPNKEKADYVCDGTNDETEINQAINAVYANGGGGVVYLLEGNYVVATSTYSSYAIRMATSTTLLGTGNVTKIKLKDSFNSDISIIAGDNQNNIVVSKLTINGNTANQASGNSTGIEFNFVSTSTINDVYIYDLAGSGSGNGIKLNSSSYNKISNSKIKNIGGIGINITTPGTGVSMYNNIESNTVDNITFGVNISTIFSSNNRITGNVIRRSSNNGINTTWSSTNAIISNEVYNSGSIGININSSSKILVSNNVVATNTGAGISFNGTSPQGNASNNNVYDNGGDGMDLDGYSNFSNNIIYNNSGYGIRVDGTTSVVSSNVLRNNGDTGNNDSIYINGSSNVVSNNQIEDMFGTGYAINNLGMNNALSGNIYSGIGSSAINDQGSGTKYTQSNRLTVDANNTDYGAAVTALTVTQSGTGAIMKLFDGANQIFTVLDGGNVGIGTTSPSVMLAVGATSTSQFLVDRNGQVTDGAWLADLIGLAYGGTNKNMTAVAGGIVYTDADSMEVTAAGTAGYVLMSNGSAAPTWVSSSSLIWDYDFSADGIMTRTATGTYVSRTITGTTNQITVTNGNGVSANPTISLPSAVYLGTSGTIGRDADNIIDFSTDNYISFKTDTNTRMTIDPLGNVGIGTTTPDSALVIGADPNNQFKVNDSGGVVAGTWMGNLIDPSYGGTGTSTWTTGGLAFSNGSYLTQSADQLFWDSTNNRLGLGTNAPLYTLDIRGNKDSYLSSIYNTATSSLANGLFVRSDGTGNILTLNYNGDDVFKVTGESSTFYHPVNFAGNGDISVGRDLNMTNEGLAYINFDGAGFIRTNSASANLDLTLSAANLGSVIVDDMFSTTGTTTLADLLFIDPSTGRIGVGTSSPDKKLSIDGTVFITGTTTIKNTALSNTENAFTIATSSSGYIFRIQGNGEVYADGAFNSTGADYAEYFRSSSANLASGEAVCIDVAENNTVKRCDRDADGNIMGIISSNPSIVGNYQDKYKNNKDYVIVAMLGQIPARVSADNEEIRPGDSLTAGIEPGFLRKANAGEATVGVALEGLEKGETGLIKILISRRNKSLTVEAVEAQISERIAAMEIEDEVAIMLSRAIRDYDIAGLVNPIVNAQIAQFDAILNVKFDNNDNKLTLLSGSLDSVIARVSALENSLGEIDHRISVLEGLGSQNLEPSPNQAFTLTAEGDVVFTNDHELLTNITNHESGSTSTVDVAIVEIVTASTTEKTAFVVNQAGSADVADFQTDGVSIVNIADTGKVTVVGEMMVDGRIMVCSGGACGEALDSAVDSTLGDMGVEGTVVAGAFAGYCAEGYVWVPGSAKYGTMPGFCVETNEHDFITNGHEFENEFTRIANISQGEAMLTCESIGEGYHLISENEWLTVAENIIRNNNNDCDSTSTGLQLAIATTTDLDELITNETNRECYATSSIAFTLSNGNKIYDLVGGVGEWTDKTVTRAGLIQPVSENWQEYNSLTNYNGLNIAPPYYYTSNNGIGRVLTGDNTLNLRGFVRGASALFDLDLSNSPTTATSSIGFRCAK